MTKFRRDQLPARESLREAAVWSSTGTTRVRRRACRAGRRCSPGSTRRCTASRRPTGPRRRTPIPAWGGWIRIRCRRWATGSAPAATRPTTAGKWHISHADLVDSRHPRRRSWRPTTTARSSPTAVEAYRKADRLDPFGFSGWIGREPHGAAKADCGTVRDGVFAEQVVELFAELARSATRRPVAGGGLVRQSPRHRVQRAGCGSSS